LNPDFIGRNDSLLQSAKCICFLGVRRNNPGPDSFQSGTAFFVSPTTLLTAGHLARHRNATFLIQPPGTFQAELFVEQLFVPRSDISTIECESVANHYENGVDICLLQVKGEYRAQNYLKLKRNEFLRGEPVDVMGYPGDFPNRYVLRMHGGRVTRETVNDVGDLFPKCELIVSHGNIESGGSIPTYNLSTVVGMSGSPVLKSGEVIGN